MKKSFENFLRLRYAVPFLILLSIVLAAVGEMTYQRTVSTLRNGIALTEARIGSARILQLLSDAEAAQLGYLLTGDASYLELALREGLPLATLDGDLRSAMLQTGVALA